MAKKINLSAGSFGLHNGIAFLSFLLLPCFSNFAWAQQPADSSKATPEIRLLEPGKPIERELQGGEVHRYEIPLAANQYLQVHADQRSVDVIVSVIDPNGKQLSEIDTRFYGLEQVSIVAKVAGSYRLHVRAFEKDAPRGGYKIWAEQKRGATHKDEDRVTAEVFLTEGKQALAKWTAEYLQKAREKFEQAVLLWRKLGDQYGEAHALHEIGSVDVYLNQYQQGINYCEQALAQYRAIGFRYGEAEALSTIGAARSALGDKKKAIEYYNQALSLTRAIADRQGEATLLSNIGTIHFYFGELLKAQDYNNQALLIFQSVNDRAGEAAVSNSLGVIAHLWGENRKALDFFTRGLSLARMIKNPRAEAHTLASFGRYYDLSGERQKALAYFDQALLLMKEMGDRRSEAVTLNSVSNIYFSMGQIQNAENNLKQALKLLRAVGDSFFVAQMLSTMATVLDARGEKQKALGVYNQVLPFLQALGNRQMEAITLNNIAVLYLFWGERQRALALFNQVLPLARIIGDRRLEAMTIQNLGGLYIDFGQPRQALEYLNQALLISQAIKDHYSEIVTLHNLGHASHALGDAPKALDYYNQSLLQRKVVSERRGVATTLHEIGRVYYAAGDTLKALTYLNEALQISRDLGDRSSEALMLSGCAEVEGDRGNFAIACAKLDSALAMIESQRSQIVSQDFRTSYFASVQTYYKLYIDLLMARHKRAPDKDYHTIAFNESERTRARGLLEILNEAHADIRQGVDSTLLAKERSLQQEINTKEQARITLLSGKHIQMPLQKIKAEIDSSLYKLREVQAQIRASSPRYAALTQPQPLSAKEIQTQVLDDETMLLEYSLGEERSFLWAVTPTTINSFVLPKRAEIDSLARRVYDLLTARNQCVSNETGAQMAARIAQADQDFIATSSALSQILLKPVAELSGNKRLLIVSDGALQYIPFGALPVPETSNQASVANPASPQTDHRPLITDYRPLVAEHEIISLPSASVLDVLRKELAGRQSASKTVAVLADPVFRRDDSRLKQNRIKLACNDAPCATENRTWRESLSKATRGLDTTANIFCIPRLVFSGREADSIMKLAPKGEGLKAVDFAANRAAATNPNLSQYRIVHFATHGLLDSEHPELSGIVFSLVNEKGEAQDGFLRLHEIYNLNLPVDLVVLSACQTALGKEIKGEGLVGLTRGFMYAGAARVAASLWNVADVATAELMKRFYQNMFGATKMRPAAALRAAQLSMWREPSFKSPYYWAAFVLQGDWK